METIIDILATEKEDYVPYECVKFESSQLHPCEKSSPDPYLQRRYRFAKLSNLMFYIKVKRVLEPFLRD